MELQQQGAPPQLFQLLVRVGVAGTGRQGGEPLGSCEPSLGAPVAVLEEVGGGVDAPVELQVHLAAPHWRLWVVLLRLVEVVVRRAQPHLRRVLQVGEPACAFHLFGGRSTAAVAVSEWQD